MILIYTYRSFLSLLFALVTGMLNIVFFCFGCAEVIKTGH